MLADGREAKYPIGSDCALGDLLTTQTGKRELNLGSVGISYVEGSIRGPAGEETVRFLIDSGAVYSLLPEAVWKAVHPMRALLV